ncbi:MAG TPA: Gfo/Idh/MocA family oxidoreductase [Planctomycetota bacterium]|jgi:predicted dehydrogenase
MKQQGISRRGFITGVAATAGTVMVLTKPVWGANDKVNLAAIGCSGKGGSDIGDATGCGANIVALCDVEEKHIAGQKKGHPEAKVYKDFRKMLDEMDKEIDAVTVSTPDHTHFPASCAAAMRGKHVFTQKPMTHSVWEARRLAQIAREKKIATLMGIQGHANEGARLLCEWVWDGAIGNVTEVHYVTNRPIWPQGIDRPKEGKPVPAGFDWDLWLNVAQERPYHDAYCPFRWRGWWDFGCGALGDIGCHVMDATFWALDLRNPTSIQAENSDQHEETAPKSCVLTYQFPARGAMPPIKVVWHDGVPGSDKDDKNKKRPRPVELEAERTLPNETYAYLVGDKGTLLHDFYCGYARIIPEGKHKDSGVTKIEKKIPRSPGHMREWINACKGGPAVGATWEYAAALTEMVNLGNFAVRSGKTVQWDAKNMKCTNLPETNKWLKREPRKGWDEYYKGPDVPEPPQPLLGLAAAKEYGCIK